MRFKRLFLPAAVVLLLTATSVSARTISRWLRMPLNQHPRATRHPSESFRDPGINLQFKFESDPVKSLLRLIGDKFSDDAATVTNSEWPADKPDRITLEDLDIEAWEALQKKQTGETSIASFGSETLLLPDTATLTAETGNASESHASGNNETAVDKTILVKPATATSTSSGYTGSSR